MAEPKKGNGNHGNVMEFMLQKLQTAKQKLNHVPYILSGQKKMAVWSDVRETLFLGCLNPKCSIVLNALKQELNYPVSELYMHACSQTEQLQFLRQFMIVVPGTLLVDLNCLKNSETLMKVHDMVLVKHRKFIDPNTLQCKNAAKLRKSETELCMDAVQCKKSCVKKKLIPAVIRKPDSSKREFSDFNEGSWKEIDVKQKQFTASQTLISRTVYSAEEIGKALTPLTLLKEAFPECSGSLQEVANNYVRRCPDGFSSVTQCLMEESQRLNNFLAVSLGCGKPWFMLTSCSLMMSWQDFLRCYHGSKRRKPALMKNISVCILNFQHTVTDDKADIDHSKTVLIEKDDESTILSNGTSESSAEAEKSIATVTSDIEKISISGPVGMSHHLDSEEVNNFGRKTYRKEARNRKDMIEMKTPNNESEDNKPSSNMKQSNTSTTSTENRLSGSKTLVNANKDEQKMEKRNLEETDLKTLEEQNGLKEQEIISGRKGSRKMKDKERNKNKKAAYKKLVSRLILPEINLSKTVLRRERKAKIASFEDENKDRDGKKDDLYDTSENKIIINKQKLKVVKSEGKDSKLRISVEDFQSERGDTASDQICENSSARRESSEGKIKKRNKPRKVKKSNLKTDSRIKSLPCVVETDLNLSGAGDMEVPLQDSNSVYKARTAPVYGSKRACKRAYDGVLSSGKENGDKKDDKNNNGTLKQTTNTDKAKLVSQEMNSDLNSLTNQFPNTVVENDCQSTFIDKCQNTGHYIPKLKDHSHTMSEYSRTDTEEDTFSFKDYLEASYDTSVRKPIDTIEKTNVIEKSPSRSIRPPTMLQQRAYTSKQFCPKVEARVGRGSKFQSKSAVSQSSQKHPSQAEYYSVPRNKLFQEEKQSIIMANGRTHLKPRNKKCKKATNSSTHTITTEKCPYVFTSYKDEEESSISNKICEMDSTDACGPKKNAHKHLISDKIFSETTSQLERLGNCIPLISQPVGKAEWLVQSSQNSADLREYRQNSDECEITPKMKKISQSADELGGVIYSIKDLDTVSIDNDTDRKTTGQVDENEYCKMSCDNHEAPMVVVKARNELKSDNRSLEFRTLDSDLPFIDRSSTDPPAPSYGSSSSRSPDIYDVYARRTRQRSHSPSPNIYDMYKKKGSPRSYPASPIKRVLPNAINASSNINTGNQKMRMNTESVSENKKVSNDGMKIPADSRHIVPFEKEEPVYVQRYTHSESKSLQTQFSNKMFKHLVMLCKNQAGSDTISNTDKIKKSQIHTDCFLCHAEVPPEDKDNVLNQLAYHVIEKLKNLNIQKNEMNSSFLEKDERNNKTEGDQVILHDKLSSFAEDAFNERNVVDSLEKIRETDSIVTQKEDICSNTGNEADTDRKIDICYPDGKQDTLPSEKEIKRKEIGNENHLIPCDFFVPIDGPVFYKLSKDGSYIPLKHTALPANAELYYLDRNRGADKSLTLTSPKNVTQVAGKAVSSSQVKDLVHQVVAENGPEGEYKDQIESLKEGSTGNKSDKKPSKSIENNMEKIITDSTKPMNEEFTFNKDFDKRPISSRSFSENRDKNIEKNMTHKVNSKQLNHEVTFDKDPKKRSISARSFSESSDKSIEQGMTSKVCLIKTRDVEIKLGKDADKRSVSSKTFSDGSDKNMEQDIVDKICSIKQLNEEVTFQKDMVNKVCSKKQLNEEVTFQKDSEKKSLGYKTSTNSSDKNIDKTDKEISAKQLKEEVTFDKDSAKIPIYSNTSSMSSDKKIEQHMTEKLCSTKQLNEEVSFDKNTDKRPVISGTFCKSARSKSAECRFYPASFRQILTEEKQTKNVRHKSAGHSFCPNSSKQLLRKNTEQVTGGTKIEFREKRTLEKACKRNVQGSTFLTDKLLTRQKNQITGNQNVCSAHGVISQLVPKVGGPEKKAWVKKGCCKDKSEEGKLNKNHSINELKTNENSDKVCPPQQLNVKMICDEVSNGKSVSTIPLSSNTGHEDCQTSSKQEEKSQMPEPKTVNSSPELEVRENEITEKQSVETKCARKPKPRKFFTSSSPKTVSQTPGTRKSVISSTLLIPQPVTEKDVSKKNDQIQRMSQKHKSLDMFNKNHYVKQLNKEKDKTYPVKQVNMKLTINEDLIKRSPRVKGLAKKARGSAKRSSFDQKLVDDQIPALQPETKILATKIELKEMETSEEHQKTPPQESDITGGLDNSTGSIKPTKNEIKNGVKYIEVFLSDAYSQELMNKTLSESHSIQTDQSVSPVNRTEKNVPVSLKKNIETEKQPTVLLQNRDLNSPKKDVTVNQNQTCRSRNFEQRYKSKSQYAQEEGIKSVSQSTCHIYQKKESVSSVSQSGQYKLKSYFHSQLKKIKEKALSRKSSSAAEEGKRTTEVNSNNIGDEPGSVSGTKTYNNENLHDRKKRIDENVTDDIDLNMNNNASKYTNRDKQINGVNRQLYMSNMDNALDIENNNVEVELDVDEVIDWEFLSGDTSRTVDEIIYTITHADGTQLIVSNQHPDFKNIVMFIEETKRVCGEDSIVIEAELNANVKLSSPLKDETVTEEFRTEPLYLEANTGVDQGLAMFASNKPNVYNSNTALNTGSGNTGCSLAFSNGVSETQQNLGISDIEIRSENRNSFNPVKLPSSDTSPNFRLASYNICHTFRNLISEEDIIQCFMDADDDDDEVEYKGISVLTGKECIHHDNIFEAFDPCLFSAGKETNMKAVPDLVIKADKTDTEVVDNVLSDFQETLIGKDCVIKQVNETCFEVGYKNKAQTEKCGNCIEKSCITGNPYQHTQLTDLNSKTETNTVNVNEDLPHDEVSNNDIEGTNANLTHSQDEIAEAEIYEVLHIPEYMPCSDMMLAREYADIDTDFIHSWADKTETNGKNEIPCVQIENDNMSVITAEPSMNPSIPSKDDLNNKCIDQYSKIREFLKEESAEMTKNINEFNFIVENLHSDYTDNIGRNTPDTDCDTVTVESRNNEKEISEDSFSDFEETLYDHEDILLDFIEHPDDEEVDENHKTSKKQFRKSQRKTRSKRIQKSTKELLLSLSNSISECKKEHKGDGSKKRRQTKKRTVIDETATDRRNLRSRKNSVKQMSGDESYDEEEERREKEEQIAAEGFVRTQQKYMEIILNKSMDIQREKGIIADIDHVDDDRRHSSNLLTCSVESLPEGLPIHGDRQCWGHNTKLEGLPRQGDHQYHKTGDDVINPGNNIADNAAAIDEDDKDIWIDDLLNPCRYQLIDDEDGVNLGGLAFYREIILPYIYINGYKFTPLKDALPCFTHCRPGCTIPRSVLNQHKGLVRSLSTWEQVYKLELIMSKKGYRLKTGDMLVKLDNLLSLLPELTREIVRRHENTTLKRSKNCDVLSYSA